MEKFSIVFWLMLYLLSARMTMRWLAGFPRELTLAILNLTAVFFFLFYGSQQHFLLRFLMYVALVVVLYSALCLFAQKSGRWVWVAFFAPITALIIVRYIPGSAYVQLGQLLGKTWRGVPNMVGISYLAFRCSRLALDVRNGIVARPGLLEYINFAFFLPTMPVGPISTYAGFRQGFAAPYQVPVGRAALRILIGAVKYQFIGNICNQLTYGGLLLDDHPHHWIDLPVAAIFYYLYLYCNFSGFCDMAIGAAGLIGIAVPENFDNPFAARNVKDFWNRWHITLSGWMRDVVFSPLSKFLVRLLGPAQANHAIALTIVAVFLLVGIWHGVGWNYAAFGAAHALGVVANHYYTIWLKKRLGREGFKAYNENRWIHAAAVVLTFSYVAASLFLFANTFPEMKQIWSALR